MLYTYSPFLLSPYILHSQASIQYVQMYDDIQAKNPIPQISAALACLVGRFVFGKSADMESVLLFV